MDPVLELQGRIISRLWSFSAVTALVGQRSYDDPPADQNGAVPANIFPYISIGPSSYDADNADCIESGEIMVQIDAWSVDTNKKQVRDMADAIRAAFRGYDMTLTQNALVLFEHWRTTQLQSNGN